MNFLAVLTRDVQLTPAVEAQPEVLDPDTGDVVTPAVDAVDATFEKVVDRCYVEDAGAAVALNEARKEDGVDTNLEFYAIRFNTQNRPSLSPVNIKAGARSQKTLEIVEVEADGETLGSVEVEA